MPRLNGFGYPHSGFRRAYKLSSLRTREGYSLKITKTIEKASRADRRFLQKAL